MAEKKFPKAGDPAVVDGARLTVMEVVEKNAKAGSQTVVRFADEDALERDTRVKEIREGYAEEEAKLEKAILDAQAVGQKEIDKMGLERGTPASWDVIKKYTALPRAEEAVLKTKLSKDLEEVPRGTVVSVNARDVEWSEVAQAWTVVGRLLSPRDRRRRR